MHSSGTHLQSQKDTTFYSQKLVNTIEITSDARSAPVRLMHSSRRASASKSTPEEMGLLRAHAFNIETRSSAPGKGT